MNLLLFFKSNEIVQYVLLDKQKTVTTMWYSEQYLLVPCVFAFFPHVKIKMKEKRFFRDENLLMVWYN